MVVLIAIVMVAATVSGFQLSADQAIQGKVEAPKQCLVFEDHFDRFDLKNWQVWVTDVPFFHSLFHMMVA